LLHGKCFAEIIKRQIQISNPTILDWGCGPARLIRHMNDLLKDLKPSLHGVDYNPKTIEWCQKTFPTITFSKNCLHPPLNFNSNYFDAIYSFSVFTHLSESSHYEWVQELWRILKPDGILIATTYGSEARNILTDAEKTHFDSGKLVVRDDVTEGKRGFAAIHSPQFVKNKMFSGWKILEHTPGYQDIWVFKKM
jgi:SAM-dependent methyltransferase